MSKKLICLVTFVFVLGMAGSASAALEGWWKLDGDATDSSGNERHGTIYGDPNEAELLADPNLAEVNWEPGAVGEAMIFDGVDDYVNIDGYKGICLDPNDPASIQPAFSVANWLKTTSASGNTEMVTWGSAPASQRLTWRVHQGRLRTEHGGGNLRGNTYVNDGEWHHCALVVTEGANLQVPNTLLYVDGVEDTTFSGSNNPYLLTADTDVAIGRQSTGTRWWPGSLDEVVITSRPLSAEQVVEVMNGTVPTWPKADKPSPADEALVEDVSVTLSWRAGQDAGSHDVYVGTTPDLTPDEFIGNQTETEYLLADLAEDATYYWRIDEIQPPGAGSRTATIHTGDVWSFYVPPMGAYDPSPADGQINAITNLSWTGGWSPVMHAVYFSTDSGAVASGTVAPAILIRATALDPGPLEADTTYYWAVDEFYGTHWSIGPVLSFTTPPELPLTEEPNLVASWTFEEGAGATSLDQSGHGYHALLVDTEWVTPGAVDDGVVAFADVDAYGAIKDLTYESTGIPEVSVFAWIRTSDPGSQYVLSYDRNEYYRLAVGASNAPVTEGQVGWHVQTDAGTSDYGSVTRVDDGEWHHIAGVFDNGTSTIYIDGAAEPNSTMGTTMGTGNLRYGLIAANSEAVTFDGANSGGPPIAELDDLRIYDRAFTAVEMRQTFGNPLIAYAPVPADGAVGVDSILSISWTPGDAAVSHDLYMGTDLAAVEAGAPEALIGNMATPMILLGLGIPPDPFMGGLTAGATYYWRVDEVNADETVTTGEVWSFTVTDPMAP